MLRVLSVSLFTLAVGCGGNMPEANEPTQSLDSALLSDDTEAICRAAGADRCQRLDVQEESRSVEVYDDSRKAGS